MWRSDFRALRNLVRTRPGRSALGATALSLASAGVFAYFLARRTILRPAVVLAIRDDTTGEVLTLLTAVVIAFAAMPAVVLAPPLLRQELFSGTQVPALLTAPVGSLRLGLRALWRSAALAATFVAPFALAPGIGLAARGVVPWPFPLWLALGAALSVLPLIGVFMLLQIVATRFCQGRRLRAAFVWLQVVTAAVLALALIAGFLKGRDLADWFADQAVEPRLPAWVETVAALPMALSLRAPTSTALAPIAAIAIAMLIAAVASLGYRRAFEAWLVGDAARELEARTGAVGIAGPGWPTTPVRSLLHKARLECTRVRSNLGFIAFLALAQVFAIAVLPAAPDTAGADSTFAVASAAQRLLTSWQILALLLSSLLVIAVIGDDQQQMALLGTAPIDRGAFVRAKAVSLGWPFLLTLVLAAISGVTIGGTSALAAAASVAVGLPILAATLGAMLALGSWPGLVQVHRDVPLANNLRTVVPITAIAVLGGFGVAARMRGFAAFAGVESGRGPLAGWQPGTAALALLGAAWALGGLSLWAGVRLASHHCERIYGAQAD